MRGTVRASTGRPWTRGRPWQSLVSYQPATGRFGLDTVRQSIRLGTASAVGCLVEDMDRVGHEPGQSTVP